MQPHTQYTTHEVYYKRFSADFGSTITAIVLNLPSMGTVMYNALIDQDMYLAGSWLFLMAIVTVIGTFISDVLLAWLDPRARKDYLKG